MFGVGTRASLITDDEWRACRYSSTDEMVLGFIFPQSSHSGAWLRTTFLLFITRSDLFLQLVANPTPSLTMLYSISWAAHSGAPGCISLALRFSFQTLRYSEEICSQMVAIHTTQLAANPALLRLHCAIKYG